MSDTIDINVNKIVETIDVFANFEHPNIEINTIEIVDNVEVNATPNVVQININSISGDVEWGEIEGILSNQTDLQNALDLKANASELGDVAFSNDYNDLDNLPTIPNNLEELHNVTETNYITPIDADSLLTFDVTNLLWKRLSWANIKSNLKTYFDTIYQTALGFTPENVANKANDLTSPDNTKYPTTQAVVDGLATKQDTLTNPITGTGANGQVAFFNGTTTQTGDNGLFWDNTNKRLGVGTNAPQRKLDVNGDFRAGNIILRPSTNNAVIEKDFSTIGSIFIRSGNSDTSIILNDNGGKIIAGANHVSTALFSVRAQGALSTDIAFRVRNSADSADLFSVNGAGQVGIGTGVDGNTLPSRLKINPLNSKVANIGSFNGATLPSTINDGDLYVYGGNLWLNSEYANFNLKGVLYRRMKLTGLQPDFFYDSFTAKNFNQFSSSNYNTFGYGSLVHTGYSYGRTVLEQSPTSIGVDSRMYDGFLMSINGPSYYDPNPQLFVDIKGNIFARGNGSYAESDWKKALTDNANKTTTVGSETNYPSAKFAIDSTTQGFLPPRMTTTQRNAIASPAAGLIVYDTTENKHYGYNGTTWNAFY